MIQVNMNTTHTVSLKKAESRVDVDFAKMPESSIKHVFEYGIRQILNDAMASAKTVAEAQAFAQKRLDNLMSGTLRASPTREGDPVRKRALELAETKIKANPAFVAWVVKAGIKVSDKIAVGKLRELSVAAIGKEGNPFMVQAKIDVESAKGLEVEDLELDL